MRPGEKDTASVVQRHLSPTDKFEAPLDSNRMAAGKNAAR
jgi:hypothetical protein